MCLCVLISLLVHFLKGDCFLFLTVIDLAVHRTALGAVIEILLVSYGGVMLT